MTIPDEAVEAAEAAVKDAMVEYGPDGHTDGSEEITRAALEAAAPHMLRRIWDEAYSKGFEAGRGEPDTPNPYEESL